MTALVAGLLLGLAGSIHCAGMCGPLTLAVRHAMPSGLADRHQMRNAMLYHAGRIFAYTTLGLFVGLLGTALALGGLGRVLSVATGVGLLMMAAGYAGHHLPSRFGLRTARWLGLAFQVVRRHASVHPLLAPLVAGIANALLPCGLLYAALLASTGFGSAIAASAFMAAYGVGTTPLLMGMWIGVGLMPRTRGVGPSRLRLLTPAMLAIVAVLLIGRGLDGRTESGLASSPSSAVHHH